MLVELVHSPVSLLKLDFNAAKSRLILREKASARLLQSLRVELRDNDPTEWRSFQIEESGIQFGVSPRLLGRANFALSRDGLPVAVSTLCWRQEAAEVAWAEIEHCYLCQSDRNPRLDKSAGRNPLECSIDGPWFATVLLQGFADLPGRLRAKLRAINDCGALALLDEVIGVPVTAK